MSEHVNVDFVAERLEDEAKVDVLAVYRRRRHLAEADEAAYLAGQEAGRAWILESASAAALRQGWLVAEGKAGLASDFEASIIAFFAREIEASLRQSSWARFDSQVYSVECDDGARRIAWSYESPFVAGVVDVAAAAWVELLEKNPERAEELAVSGAPANRTAYLEALEDAEWHASRLWAHANATR
jgi:hypothetical protein